MTTLQPKNRNRTDVVGYKQQRRKKPLWLLSRITLRSIPIAVTKDGTKELNMCVVLQYCNSSYNNNQ